MHVWSYDRAYYKLWSPISRFRLRTGTWCVPDFTRSYIPAYYLLYTIAYCIQTPWRQSRDNTPLLLVHVGRHKHKKMKYSSLEFKQIFLVYVINSIHASCDFLCGWFARYQKSGRVIEQGCGHYQSVSIAHVKKTDICQKFSVGLEERDDVELLGCCCDTNCSSKGKSTDWDCVWILAMNMIPLISICRIWPSSNHKYICSFGKAHKVSTRPFLCFCFPFELSTLCGLSNLSTKKHFDSICTTAYYKWKVIYQSSVCF